jgi:hypothetical protein
MSTVLKVLMLSAEVACSDPFQGVDVCVAYVFCPLFSATEVVILYVKCELMFLLTHCRSRHKALSLKIRIIRFERGIYHTGRTFRIKYQDWTCIKSEASIEYAALPFRCNGHYQHLPSRLAQFH